MAEFGVTYTLEDAYTRKTRRGYTIEAIDFATALTEAGNMVVDLAAISEAQVLWYTLAQQTVYSDTVTAGANKDEGITLTVRKTDNKNASIQLPAPINSVINGDGTVDMTATEVVDFAANFLSGVFRVSDHEVVTEFLRGKLDK